MDERCGGRDEEFEEQEVEEKDEAKTMRIKPRGKDEGEEAEWEEWVWWIVRKGRRR
jgi:hypothetical protein